jgi:DNA-binding CsgD family transcriptional regulator
MVATLNELDKGLCNSFGLLRSEDATTLDAAIEMAAGTTSRLVTRGVHSDAARAIGGLRPFVSYLQAQVQAREMRVGGRADVVRSLTDGIRRMKRAGSLQGLGRQACSELCEALGFDRALISFVEDDAFVVEESSVALGSPRIVKRRGCVPERECVLLLDTMRTNDGDLPATAAFRTLLDSAQYLVAPVIAESRVVALFHVSRGGECDVSVEDVDVLDTFASAYSLLHERMLNTERVQQQRTSIARAAARLTEEVDRIAAAAVSLDIEQDDDSIEPPTIASDSALARTLSGRERQVFERLVLGASNADIADELVITIETVKTHVKRILRKIGAINRSEAIALYMDEVSKHQRRRN